MAREGGILGRGAVLVLLVLAAAMAVTALARGAESSLAARTSGCPNAGAKPHEVSLAKLRRSLSCLINHKRHDRGRQRLDPNMKLERAAQHHTNKMLEQDCFEHRCDNERGFTRRVRRTGYLRGASAWAIAENLGYESTPREMLRRFLHKRFDRRNMLKPKFEDIGIGVGWGTPDPDRNDSLFATYTVVFGWRRG